MSTFLTFMFFIPLAAYAMAFWARLLTIETPVAVF